MFGQVSHELVVKVSASKVWELYGSLELAKLVEKQSDLVSKIEVLQGDGGEGTILKLIFAPGKGMGEFFSEKFTKVDNEKRVKETEVVEGGYLEMGFTLYRTRLEIIENGEGESIIRSTIEYEVKEEAAANASLVSIEPLANIAQISNDYLLNKHS